MFVWSGLALVVADITLNGLTQSAGAVKYTDCTSAEG